MPILWRYLLGQYLRVLLLCVFAFLAILLTTRLDEIAHFITLGAEGYYVAWFILHQIPYILPIALPVSCLISAVLLVQRLSQAQELTALRACGIALRDILTPLLVAAALLSLANFYVVSEIATTSHLSAGLLKSELRAVNPLVLLRNKQLLRMKGIFFDVLGASKHAESASDVVIAVPNKHNNRLNLVLAKHLQTTPTSLSARNVTLISSFRADDPNRFDHLMLENIEQATTSIQDFSQMIQKKAWTLNNDHLRTSLLLVRLQEEKEALLKAQSAKMGSLEQKQLVRNFNRTKSEIIRRISISFAVFTFTLMGLAFGISISRNRSNKGLYFIIGLAAFFMIAFFTAKGIDSLFLASSLLYTIPHLIIIGLSLWSLNRATHGVE